MNPRWGVDYMLKRKLDKAEIVYEAISAFGTAEEKAIYTKYGVRSTPVLLVLDNDVVADKIVAVDEIVEYLKNVPNTEI